MMVICTQSLVAIFMVTYNHENYIEEAVESIVSQFTNFKYTLFIAEDCSTDNTRNICIELGQKHLDKIHLVLNSTNMGGFANSQNLMNICSQSGAKYIALCEGDDYWTDPYKLQKQVDFLEANTDFDIHCGHARMISDDVNRNDKRIHEEIAENTVYTIDDFAENSRVVTCTAMIRNIGFRALPKYFKESPAGDWCLYTYILATTGGKVLYENSDFAAYRAHAGGIYSSLNTTGFYRFYEKTLRVIYKLLHDPVLKLKSRQKRNWYLEQIFREYLKEKKSWKAFRVWASLLGNGYPAKSALMLLLEWKNG